jgi:hypothetical protein
VPQVPQVDPYRGPETPQLDVLMDAAVELAKLAHDGFYSLFIQQ